MTIAAVAFDVDRLGPYFILATVTFLVSNLILDVALIHFAYDRRSGWPDFLDILIRWIIIVLVVGAILYAGELLGNLDPRVLLVWMIATPLMMWCALRAAQLGLRRMFRSRLAVRKAVIVGANDVGLRLESVLRESPILRTEMQGFFEDRASERVPPSACSRILGRCEDLADFVRRGGASLVYITIPMSRQQRILDLLSKLSDSTASIYFVPDLLIFNLIQGRIDTLEGLPLIAVCESPFIGLSGLIKRMMDVVIAGALVMLTIPIFMLVALVVRLSSPGPIIFRQTRYGLDGHPI
jgi:putative colanic acid biosynthesis UDP-glucose lipid carrier transferase